MSNKTKGRIVKGCAICLDVGVPLAATLSQFPLWVEQSSAATVSGLFLIFAFFSALPFIKQIKAFFKSPSVVVIWAVLFALLIALRNIIDEMIVVCFAGMISNVIGAGLWRLGTAVEGKPDKVKADAPERSGQEGAVHEQD